MADEVLVELYHAGDLTAAETEARSQHLRTELLELDEVVNVGHATAGPPPEGARGLDVAALGAMVVAVEPGVAALSKIVTVIRGWLTHRGGSRPTGESVRLTVNGQSIELGAATAAQQQALVDQFLQAAGSP